MSRVRGERGDHGAVGGASAAALLMLLALALLPPGAGCGPRPADETAGAAPAPPGQAAAPAAAPEPLELTADEVEDQVRSIQQNPNIPEAQKAAMIAAARARGPKTGAPPPPPR